MIHIHDYTTRVFDIYINQHLVAIYQGLVMLRLNLFDLRFAIYHTTEINSKPLMEYPYIQKRNIKKI